MRSILALLIPILAATAHPVAAQTVVYEEIVEEEIAYLDPGASSGGDRFVAVAPAALPRGGQ
jgi:hypothetical protein